MNIKLKLVVALLSLFALSASVEAAKLFDKKKKSTKWYTEQTWLEGWKVQPSKTNNRDEFERQYNANPLMWKKMFQFLAQNDLTQLPIGKTQIMGDSLYVAVSEYVGKEPADAKLEAHIKYIDMQYVAVGCEKMELVPLANTTVKVPYNATKDVVFLNSEPGNFVLATPAQFYLFFPSDAHRPSMKSDGCEKVKKVVFKILAAPAL